MMSDSFMNYLASEDVPRFLSFVRASRLRKDELQATPEMLHARLVDFAGNKVNVQIVHVRVPRTSSDRSFQHLLGISDTENALSQQDRLPSSATLQPDDKAASEQE